MSSASTSTRRRASRTLVALGAALDAASAATGALRVYARLSLKLALWRLKSRRAFNKKIASLPEELRRELTESYSEVLARSASPGRHLRMAFRLAGKGVERR